MSANLELKPVLWSRSRKEPELLAEAGILKFRLRLRLLAPDQTKISVLNHNLY